MKIHLVSLPHTETTKAYSWCAFTEKNRKFSGMMHSLGYDVRLYAGEMNEAPCTEHIQLFSRAEQASFFGGYDWSRDVYNEWSGPAWDLFNARAIEAIRERAEPGDIFAMSMGYSQHSIAEALPYLWPVEVGIGYQGVWAPYRVFESYAWMHYLAAKATNDDIRYFDTVIPNSFESVDFPLGEGKGEYALFVGRLIRRKGIQIAVETTERLGIDLVVAGQGVIDAGSNWLQGIDIRIEADHVTHVGVVGPKERAELMGAAAFVMTPSIYLEPFCGVHVEAMMCGTPVVTTDWGAFTETYVHGVHGFRCRTLAEFVDAGRHSTDLDRSSIHDFAHHRYSTDHIRYHYDLYFKRLATLKGKGWYEMPEVQA
jgi:glycosyltransferase involved in cell wall biosynthesis